MLSVLSPGAACAILLLVGVPLGLLAQATTVSVHGTIGGNDGSIPEGARVELRSRETNSSRDAIADRTGSYRVLGLAPGLYAVTVRALGYRQQRREAVRLVLGQRAVLDFALERGAIELEPTVVTAGRAFEIQRTDVSTAVLQEEIERLPLNSRNVLNVAAIAPGIQTYAVEGGRSVPAAGAMPVTEQRFANLYVDGVELKGMYSGQVIGTATTSMIPQEAVREFRVYLNPYDVEHTRGASYIMSAITHRGGNTLEGSLFGFLQNKALVAKGSLQSEEPAYNRYQAGGNLRGPIVKDRLFFSLSYERQFTDNFIDVVPGQPPERPDIWAEYSGTFKAPQRHHTGLLRLTAPLRSHTLDAIWTARHIWSESGFGVRLNGFMLAHEAGLTGINRVNSVQLRGTYTSASVVNEVSLHFLDSRFTNYPLFPGPTFQYPGIQLVRPNFPLVLGDRHLRVINKTSYTVNGASGHHVLKTGVEVSRTRTNVYRPTNADGFFLFRRDTSSLPYEGRIAVGAADPTSTREAEATIEGWLIGAYLQDEWQPVSRLTISAGLRYDTEINTLNQKLVTPSAEDTALHRALGEEFLKRELYRS